MDPISMALGLAAFSPAITRWLGGGKAVEVAQQVVDIAQAATGKTGQAALDAIKADSVLQIAFQQAIAGQAGNLEKAYLADRQTLREPGRRNLRADILAYAAIGGLISLVWGLLVHAIAEGPARDLLLILSGALVAIVKDVYGFEFGSSRGSEAKSEQITQLIGGLPPAKSADGRRDG